MAAATPRAAGDGGLPRAGRIGQGLVLLLGVAAVVGLLFHGPIPQDPAYHGFADARTMFGIPRAFDVLSNLGFVLVGALGTWWMCGPGRGALARNVPALDRRPFLVLFPAVLLTGFGSAYYHWAPDSPRLFWDRLPLTLAFMALYDAVLADRASVAGARRLLLPLLAVGAGSMLCWRATDDLRLYALVQFFPLATIPVLLGTHPGRTFRTREWVAVVAWYAGAKLCETFDGGIFRALGATVSGHTIKHLLAAGAPLQVLLALRRIARP